MSLESLLRERSELEHFSYFFPGLVTTKDHFKHDELDYEIDQELRR